MVNLLETTRGVSLRELLPHARWLGGADVRVTSCCADSRHVRPGDLFVALPGSQHDGHHFCDEAISKGAAAVLAERPLPVRGVPICIVEDTRDAYGRLCHAMVGNPSEQLKLIGVTGTNGKTTTAHLIASVLQTAGAPTALAGTLGYFDGCETYRASHTTPPPPAVAGWLARAVASGCTHAVMEVSSHGLVQGRVAGAEFDAACITNIQRDHLDFHGTMSNYRAAKARLLECLAEDGLVVLNGDDRICAGLVNSVAGPLLTIGIDGDAQITATMLERYLSEQTFLITAGCETAAVRTRMIGQHHVYNCLIATAVGLAYGIDLATVVRGLEAVEKVPGRMERIECGQPFGVFVDYAHSPDALATSLAALRGVTEGRILCVFGAGGDRDRSKRPLMGQVVERLADLAIVTTDNPRCEDPAEIAGHVLAGFAQPDRGEVILDRAAAILWALAEARPGDSVLIAGKGHEICQIVGNRRLAFDDRQLARDILYHIGSPQPARAAA
ncbi:MAG: UDP-N-acetylmuramoyl-L-alanyl-D-glutamate--2,6-diaminopimelate ligase [Pirellulales bacterium]